MSLPRPTGQRDKMSPWSLHPCYPRVVVVVLIAVLATFACLVT